MSMVLPKKAIKKPSLQLGGGSNEAAGTADAQNTSSVSGAQSSAPKYNKAACMMLANSLDDLVQQRFKNGWFTFHKFTEESKKNPKLLEEMQEFGKVKLERPDIIPLPRKVKK